MFPLHIRATKCGVLLRRDAMARPRRRSQELADQITLIASMKFRVGISYELWAEVVSYWELPTIRRERDHIRNKFGRATKVEVVVGLGIGLESEMRRTLVERLGRHCEFIATAKNVLVHISHMRRTQSRGRLPTFTHT